MITPAGGATSDVESVVAAASLAAVLAVVGWVIVLPLLLGAAEDAERWWRGR